MALATCVDACCLVDDVDGLICVSVTLLAVVTDGIDVVGGYGSGSQSSEADENSRDADYTVQTSALVISH